MSNPVNSSEIPKNPAPSNPQKIQTNIPQTQKPAEKQAEQQK